MSEMTPELFTELIEATYRFGDAYHEAATAKDSSESAKAVFYTKADEALSLRRLARKTIIVDPGNVSEHVALYHPGWRLVEIDEMAEDGSAEAIIEQDPSQMKFSFTNLEDGHLYQRTYTEGAPQLDEGRLQEEDPDLYDDIHEWPPPPPWLLAWTQAFDDIQDEIQDHWYDFLEHGEHNIEPLLKDPKEWTKEQAAALQPYLVPGKRMMKIIKPRKATEEEIQEAIDLLNELVAE